MMSVNGLEKIHCVPHIMNRGHHFGQTMLRQRMRSLGGLVQGFMKLNLLKFTKNTNAQRWVLPVSYMASNKSTTRKLAKYILIGPSWFGWIQFVLVGPFWTGEPTLLMFCLLNPQMNACEPNPKTTSSDFNRWKSVTKIFCFHAISTDICLLF